MDRAGVEARARTTAAFVRDGFAFARCFAGLFEWLFPRPFASRRAVRLFAFVDGPRALERALPFFFRCDAEAFNCFPLFGLRPRRTVSARKRQRSPNATRL